MAVWYSKDLGDGVDAFEPTTQIQNAFLALARAQTQTGHYSFDAAVFSRYDLDTNVVRVYFSPSAQLLATAFGATLCEKPTPTEGLALLAGDARAWEEHFPGYLKRRRSNWQSYR